MVPGYQALSSIEQALADLRGQQRQSGDRLQTLNARISELNGEQAQAYRDLARFRMEQDPDGLAERLDAAGSKAAGILAKRQRQGRERRQKIARLEDQNAQIRGQRAAAAAKLIDASEAHAEAQEDLRAELARQDPWTRQQAATERATALATAARAKTDQAQDDRVEKGRPYEADNLFVYLWRRNYGLSTYSASAPIRALDRWVAGLTGYQHARPNYAMLLEIPKRLDEHADRLEAAAEAERTLLEDIERQAFESAPTAATARELKQLRDDIADIDRQLSVVDGELDTLSQREDESAAGKDAMWRKAAGLLSASLESDSLRRLWQQAKQTPSPNDERLVERIEDIQATVAGLEEEILDDREAHRQLSKRHEDLTQISRDFRQQGWDDSGSVFGDNSLTGAVLGEFLGGAISAGRYWRQIESGQRWRRSRGDSDRGGGIDMGRGWSGGWSGPDIGPRGGGRDDIPVDFGGEDFSTGGDF
jgi:hypothetical protein